MSDESNLPILYDFWAPWCGPCRALAPTVDQLEKRFAGRLRIQKVNVDEHPADAEQFDIRSIPTLVLSQNDQEHLRVVGAKSFAALEKEIGGALDKISPLS